MNLLDIVCEDSITEILRNVFDPFLLKALTCTCKKMQSIIVRRFSEIGTYFNYKLNSDQVNTLNAIDASNEKYIYITLPMSAGKTALALIYCLKRVKKYGGSAVFYVTNKVLETAELEVKKLTAGKKCGTTIYVYTAQNKTFYKEGIVIASRQCTVPFKMTNVHTVICDEAHMGSLDRIVKGLPSAVTKMILLSAAQPVFNTAGELTSIKQKAEVIGHLCTEGMILPEKNLYILSSNPNDCYYVKPESVKHATDITDTYIRPEYKFCQDLIDSDLIMQTAIFLDVLQKLRGRTFICFYDINPDYPCWFSVGANGFSDRDHDLRLPIFQELGITYVKTLNDVMKTNSDLVAGDMSRFSEGVNLNMFKNLVLICCNANYERLRQTVGRIVRTNNKNKSVNIYYISSTLQNVLMSTVPRELEEEYCKLLGNKSLHLRNKSANGSFRPNMSLHEICVLACNTKSKGKSLDWIEENNGFQAFTRNELHEAMNKR